MSHKLSRRTFLAGAIATPFIAAGCGVGSRLLQNTRSAAALWNLTHLDAISASRFGPPIVARTLGMVATAMYDAWVNYHPVAIGTRLGGTLRRPSGEHTAGNKSQAVSFAAYRLLVELFPLEKARFDARMTALGYDPNNNSMDTTTAIGIGNTVAKAIIDFRRNDGSNQLGNYADTTSYVPINTPTSVVDPSQWQQLRFANGQSPAYITPHWGNVVPFALSASNALRPPTPPAYGTPEYRDEVQQLVDIYANLTDTQKAIAEYWADGPRTVLPPGHWHLFAQEISLTRNYDIDLDVRMFMLVGNAVFDAGISSWECKRAFNTSRPYTVIRSLYSGQQVYSFTGATTGVQKMDGSQWFPYQSPNFITPPFPEYVSGHSTFSAASAEVLMRFTGSDDFGSSIVLPANSLAFEANTPKEPVLLHWNTFSEAADQAGISRLYGGIHFESGDLEGRRLGRRVGSQVWEKAHALFTGTPV